MCLLFHSSEFAEILSPGVCVHPLCTGRLHQSPLLQDCGCTQQAGPGWQVPGTVGLLRPHAQRLQREAGQFELGQSEVLAGLWRTDDKAGLQAAR